MPILPDAIKEIVTKFGDPDYGVCNTASNSFVKLVKHGNFYYYFNNKANRTGLLLGDIRQMPIMPNAIRDIVAKFDDSDRNVCITSINSLVELAKHGNL